MGTSGNEKNILFPELFPKFFPIESIKKLLGNRGNNFYMKIYSFRKFRKIHIMNYP